MPRQGGKVGIMGRSFDFYSEGKKTIKVLFQKDHFGYSDRMRGAGGGNEVGEEHDQSEEVIRLRDNEGLNQAAATGTMYQRVLSTFEHNKPEMLWYMQMETQQAVGMQF